MEQKPDPVTATIRPMFLRFLRFVLFLAGIPVAIAAGFAAYYLVVHCCSSEVVVYGHCYDFGGEILDCQPGETSEPCDSFYAPQMGGRLDCQPGKASRRWGVTVEPGHPVLNLGCYSECFPRETPYVYRKVPMFGDFPCADFLVGVIAALITGFLYLLFVCR